MSYRTLEELYRQHKGKVSDKWSIYLTEYERLFVPYRALPINLLEIGVQNGGSLELWAKYFPSAVHLVGCDIAPACAKLAFSDPRVSVVVGDANADDTCARILSIAPRFDLIIDDGSHTSGDIARSFAKYFAHLNDGGLFIAEDLHCSYWQSHEGGLFHPGSSIAFLKRLADIVNHEHWGIPADRKDILESFQRLYGFDVEEELLAHVHSVEFINSLCVVKKREPSGNVMGLRFVVGEEAGVDAESLIRGLRFTYGSVSSQNDNPWSVRAQLPEDELDAKTADLSELRGELQFLRAGIASRDAQIHRLNDDVSECKRELSLLHSGIACREALIQKLNEHVKAKEAEAQNLRERLRASEIAKEHAVAAAHQQLAGARAEIDAHALARHETLTSTSWRVTAPVRHVGFQLRRAKRLAAVVPVAIKGAGGLRPAASLAGAAIREAGLSGLKRHLSRIERGHEESVAPVVEAPSRTYAQWIAAYDTLTDSDRERLLTRIASWKARPLISVVMPTYNANPVWLREAIESVRAQLYPYWEICIADDASSNVEACALLKEFAALDPRIKVVFRSVNGHISAASNSAIEMATGEWIALMDHDDLLAEHALYWIADCINAHPDAQLIYSDEDKIDGKGTRSSPYFKADWNIDLFYSHNMFSHLGAFNAELVRKVGGFRVGFEGSQDYDLTLRCLEHVRADQVQHVAKVLYHWRIHAESTAHSGDAKPYALIAGERALNEHFQRMGIEGMVEQDGNAYRARYALPQPAPLVSLIIPTRNAVHLVRQCVTSIQVLTDYENYEIILVDNGSDDSAALAYFKSIQSANVRVIRDDGEFNYSALNNRAVAEARGTIVGLINNDIEVISPEWLSEMVSIAIQPGVGAVGARLWFPNYTLQHGGVLLGVGGVANHAHKSAARSDQGYFGRASLIQSFSAVTAACLIVRKDRYEAVGGLNEIDLKVAFNDVDFCLKLREAGFRNVWTPYANLFHHESATRGEDVAPEKRERFVSEVNYMLQRWGEDLHRDPAYSPNLTLESTDFGLAWPPRVLRGAMVAGDGCR